MKKFVTSAIVIAALIFSFRYVRYNTDFLDNIWPEYEIQYSLRTNKKNIEMKNNGSFEDFEIRGVNLGAAIPGKWPSDNSIPKSTYLRWFKQIQDLGANTIRIYTVYNPEFYDAFYEFNSKSKEPLYLIQGVWVNDYFQNSHLDGHDSKYKQSFIKECRQTVNVIHGNAYTDAGYNSDYNRFDKDISKWVLGYIVGSEWRETTVVYTDKVRFGMPAYEGDYLYADDDASPFENMLTEVMDKLVSYETKKYHEQRLVSFCNFNITDPFDYSKVITGKHPKVAKIDANHINTSDEFKAGFFISYHLYAHFPDYYEFIKEDDKYIYDRDNDNSYRKYLDKLNEYHNAPVVIAEYGVSTGRGIAIKDFISNKTQGHLNEDMQGEALIDCYNDIVESGCSGSLIFSWQDEWHKLTANTQFSVDENKKPFWCDAQTDDEFFGLMSFDPGNKTTACYVDGDVAEWDIEDEISSDGSMSLSMKYDEMYVYFNVFKDNFNPETDTIYIPIDVTPKSGSNFCKGENVKFDRPADFLIVIDGKENSNILVQKRYNALDAIYGFEIYNKEPFSNPPDKNSPVFSSIRSLLKTKMDPIENLFGDPEYSETFPTGILEYGNANPDSSNFNSLADFCYEGNNIEIKIPWSLLNFSNPSEMEIHDDYYEHYGVENLKIKEIYAGVGTNISSERIKLKPLVLKGWKNKVTYHERLKKSYYMLQDYWNKGK